jgi:hypothetical protein
VTIIANREPTNNTDSEIEILIIYSFTDQRKKHNIKALLKSPTLMSDIFELSNYLAATK